MKLFRLLPLFVAALTTSAALGITVSGTVTAPGGGGMGGVTITVEQVGGELPPLITTTAANGTFSVSDPLLFGNVRVTPSVAAFGFSPAFRETFTDSNLPNQNFSAFSLAEITVLDGAGTSLATPAAVVYAPMVEGTTQTLNLTLRNDGTVPLTDIGITLTGPQAAEFSVSPEPPVNLAAGASVVVPVLFTPVATGTHSATLSIASNDTSENPFVVNLSATVVSITVSNTGDSGAGSLRESIANAALLPGATSLIFAPALSGQTITLASEIVVNDPPGVTVDATGLAAGLTVSGGTGANQLNRLFKVNAGSTLNLAGLNLADGNGNGEDRAGAILNAGTLFLSHCTVQNNVVSSSQPTAGGAIFNGGTLTADHCDFFSNRADLGGALYNEGNATLTNCALRRGNSIFSAIRGGGAILSIGSLVMDRCTVSGHQVFLDGGGIWISGSGSFTYCTLEGNGGLNPSRGGALFAERASLVFDHCTIVRNSATDVGGVHLSIDCVAHLSHCIITENLSSQTPKDLRSFNGPIFLDATNIIGSRGPATGVPDLSVAPLLAPLGDYGGPTQTRALLPGSPARNAATGSTATTDQRGFPIVGVADIGAYEAGTVHTGFNAYIWETLPVSASPAQHGAAFDFDGDQRSNESEWAALTDAADGSSFFASEIAASGGDLLVTFPSAANRSYTLQQSDTLATGSFINAPGFPLLSGTGAVLTFTMPMPAVPRRFFRVVAAP